MLRRRLPIALPVVLASVASIAVLALPGSAHAQEAPAGTTPPATNAPGVAGTPASTEAATAAAPAAPAASTPATNEKPQVKDEEEEDFKSIAITANPLSLILTRIGVNVEWLPAKHHALVVNPYFQSVSAGEDRNKSSYTNFGAEAGYRFYTGSRGANGFFVGPSLLVMQSSVTNTVTPPGGTTTESSGSVTAYGAALDLGGQHVTRGGFTIGGGIGAMYLASSGNAGATSSTVKFSGVLPRFLLTVGYSF